ncbi:TetR/AcrR family transcriptional regulator [Actinoplanes oblitus]|uniref:TetR/AcrR family transcriptional regulator n=1 Tax=Actinoplanes oblitus TaxID=3040509 RepID=A0ABY8WQX8_9ACTN|nr:TetR/AcrR family transcriptional regulator [Actinoplanes oblitus]WIN00297.1 TetR/AcrR family transcriptional regulator [Actinoplanes oblitus]
MRLNRDQVLSAALDLLDEAGLDQLTMRRLSTALGVQNGATYWHFRSKQALLEAMADTLLTGVADTLLTGVADARHTGEADLGEPEPWDERIARLAHRLRRALLSRRDGARLFSAAFFPLPNALAYGEAMIATLCQGGLTARDASWAADTLTYYVVGHTIEEQLAAALPDGGAEGAARLAEAVDPQRHPHLFAALAHIPAPHHEDHFAYGLQLVVAGIRSTATAGRVADPR